MLILRILIWTFCIWRAGSDSTWTKMNLASNTSSTSRTSTTSSTSTTFSTSTTSNTSSTPTTPTADSTPSTALPDNLLLLRAWLNPPRDLVVEWHTVPNATYTVSLFQYGLNSYNITTSTSPVTFKYLDGGIHYRVMIIVEELENTDELDFYLPWQLSLTSTNSTIRVEWDERENDLVDRVCITTWGRLPFCRSYLTLKGNYAHFVSLQSNTSYNILIHSNEHDSTTLVTKISTAQTEFYSSLDWECHMNPCTNGICVPTSSGLVRTVNDTYQYQYYYLCRNTISPAVISEGALGKDIASRDSITLQSPDLRQLSVTYAEFIDTESQYSCSLATALAIIRYWCNGLTYCRIDYSMLISFFEPSVGCFNTDIASFILQLDYEVVNFEDYCYPLPSTFYVVDHFTCYKYIGNYSFSEGRQRCLDEGGDLPYYFDKSFKHEFWTLGESRQARAPHHYTNTMEPSYSTNGTYKRCNINICPAILTTYCALAPPPTSAPPTLDIRIQEDHSCNTNQCGSGNVCYITYPFIGASIDTASYESESSFMCQCNNYAHGDNCTQGGIGESFDVTVVPLEDEGYTIQADIGSVLHIEYVYYGIERNDTYAGCYSPFALDFLRLQCENNQSCFILDKNLHDHLDSFCHPIHASYFVIRYTSIFDKYKALECPAGTTLASDEKCLGTTEHKYSSANEAKLECNSIGGDLALNTSDICHNLTETYWVELEDYEEGFSLSVISPGKENCSEIFITSPYRGICTTPPIIYENMANATTNVPTTTPATTEIRTTNTTTTTTTTTPTPYCPETAPASSDYPDWIWGEQLAGTTAEQDCRDPYYNGTATWDCGIDGSWVGENPDMSGCYYTVDTVFWVGNVQNTSVPLAITLDDLQDSIRDERLYAGDIESLITIMEESDTRHQYDLTQAKPEEIVPLSESFTDDILAISDETLDDTEVWKQFEDDDELSRVVTKLQNEVENAVVSLSVVLQEMAYQSSHETLYSEIESFNQGHYDYPRNREFYHPGKDFPSTYMMLPRNLQLSGIDEVFLTFTAYNTLHCVMPGAIPCEDNLTNVTAVQAANSAVMGATIGDKTYITDNDDPVKAYFDHVYTGNRYIINNVECAWWSSDGLWNTSGCMVQFTNDYVTVCYCTHLTNLAVIMDINGALRDNETLLDLAMYITIIGCSISIVALAITILMLATDKKSWSKTTFMHVNMSSCLLISEILLMTGLDATDNGTTCAVITAMLFYFLLATFTWSSVEALNVYLLFIKVFPIGHSPMKYYILFAYSAPALIVGITAGITQGEGFGTNEYCWLDYESNLTWAFAIPLFVILMTNLIIFFLATRIIKKQSGVRSTLSTSKDRDRNLRVAFSLATVLGLTWILGFFYMFNGTEVLAIVFTLVNSCQGIMFFVILILMNEEQRKRISRLTPWKKTGKYPNDSYQLSDDKTGVGISTAATLDYNPSKPASSISASKMSKAVTMDYSNGPPKPASSISDSKRSKAATLDNISSKPASSISGSKMSKTVTLDYSNGPPKTASSMSGSKRSKTTTSSGDMFGIMFREDQSDSGLNINGTAGSYTT